MKVQKTETPPRPTVRVRSTPLPPDPPQECVTAVKPLNAYPARPMKPRPVQDQVSQRRMWRRVSMMISVPVKAGRVDYCFASSSVQRS